MASLFNRKIVTVLVSLLIGIGFLSLPLLIAPGSEFSWMIFRNPHTQCDLVSYVLALIFFYLNLLWFIPNLYYQKKFLLYGSIAALFFFLIVIFPVLYFENGFRHHKMMNPGIWKEPPMPPPQSRLFFEFIQNFFLFLVSFLLAFSLSIRNRLKQAEKEKLNAELSYLKAQINPHFLFNTLNSIYSLAIQRSDETAAAVVKLSGMMRYITTETHKDHVALDKELDYIRSYIELQRVRLGETVKVDFKIEGSTFEQEITPLVLITFVENAFKYGVNPEEESTISIHLRITGSELRLDVKNKKVRVDYSEESRSGLGIRNAEQRLKMVYPGRHELLISDGEKEYSVSLLIQMS